MTNKSVLLLFLLLALSLSACAAAAVADINQPGMVESSAPATEAPEVVATATQFALLPAAESVSAAQPVSAPLTVGPNPENIPAGYNPLTGLPVSDPATLELPAVLISITNFPPSARPQAGLSFSPWVFELYIAEGMTRYLATFYGDFPKTASAVGQPATAEVGPVRSGRLPYVYIRDFFQNSCLVYAGATEQIRARLRGCATVFGDDSADINSAMLDVTRLQKIAEQNKRPSDTFNYTGNLFSSAPAAQGAPASQIDVYYSYLNQGQWQYNPTSGAYLKLNDFADGSGKFTPATDRLTGQQLAFANVVVLYVEHTVINPYIIDVKMGPGEKGRATLFRDGQKFEAFWTTVSGEYEQTTGLRRPLRFVDANGQPFALKPGQTWVHLVTLPSEVQDQGAGKWKLRFYAPAGAK